MRITACRGIHILTCDTHTGTIDVFIYLTCSHHLLLHYHRELPEVDSNWLFITFAHLLSTVLSFSLVMFIYN